MDRRVKDLAGKDVGLSHFRRVYSTTSGHRGGHVGRFADQGVFTKSTGDFIAIKCGI